MNGKLVSFVCCALFLTTSISCRRVQPHVASGKISLTIETPGGDGQASGDLNIHCTFANGTKNDAFLWLPDHKYVGFSARVTDLKSNVLTRTRDFGDWWTSDYTVSERLKGPPDGEIILKPGEKVVRVVPLAIILGGLPPLSPGEYDVELRSGDIVSNRLRLKVVVKR